MRYALLRQAIGIHVIYRNTGGGLIVGGLSYAALFALIPTTILVVAGVYLLVDDPVARADAVDVIDRAFPAFAGITDTAVDTAGDLATLGGVIALIGFAWGASGLYLNLTRAMERFFPGERVSGALARVVGVLLVVAIIVGVLAVVFVAGILTVVAHALDVDVEQLLSVVGAAVTLVLATAIAYGVYRVVPANPPTAPAARLPAMLVGIAIAAMTLLYGLVSPWLVAGFAAFGVAASVFVALVWLRVVFLAMVYGAAMARYRDYVVAAAALGLDRPDEIATEHAMAEEQDRIDREVVAATELERRSSASLGPAAEAVDDQPTAASGPSEGAGSGDEP